MEKEVVTSFRVNEELWRETRAYAVRNGFTVKQLIEFLIRKELKENKILKENKPKENRPLKELKKEAE